ncbi:MAG: hypothetical protein DDT19_02472 [Syntrophomonadaceae bacterium]|nr:hypothetical protein [Bacillota bacterium]
MTWLFNIFRRWWKKRIERQFLQCLQSEIAKEFLRLLLKLMSLALKGDEKFRRNIKGFRGRYQFRSVDNSVTVAAVFTGKGLEVKETLLPDADVSIIFKDSKSLMKYLLATDRDILRLLLNNKVVVKGNMNYMFKFEYMANHLQLVLTQRRW